MKRIPKRNLFVCILLFILAVALIILLCMAGRGNLKVTGLKVNHTEKPLGITEESPVFSWELLDEKKISGSYTKAFQVYVWRVDFVSGGKELVWDSKKIEKERLSRIDYQGKELQDHSQYEWQVFVWDANDRKFESDISTFETAYMKQEPFSGCDFIQVGEEKSEGLPIFVKNFYTENKKVVKAYLISSALGCYDAYINGKRVGRYSKIEDIYDELKPGWTNYNKSLLYNTYDITSCLKNHSENTIAVMLSNGWCLGKIAHETYDYDKAAFIGKMLLFYDDGSKEEVVTDTSWEYTCDSAVRSADIYDGEVFDGRKLTLQKASEHKESDVLWKNAEVKRYDDLTYHSYYGENVVVQEKYSKTAKIKMPVVVKGGESLILDMGQNMQAVPYMELQGERGTKIELRFAEMLNDSGEEERGNDGSKGSLYRANYRTAESKVVYYCNGEKRETYQTTFSYFGYRYIEIIPSGDITLYQLDSRFIGIENDSTNEIVTENEKVNQLFSNICWTQRNNWLLVATDCPQRDERLPWTGDLQVYCKTSLYNGAPYQFYKKWCMDAVESQMPDGSFPNLIPYNKITGTGNAGWADAGIIVPYRLWQYYGDESFIHIMWDSMIKYMDWLEKSNCKGANPTYGDWLAYEETDAEFVAVAYYARDAKYMSEMADAIGRHEEAVQYEQLFNKIKDYFAQSYIKNEHLTEKSQTACLLALEMELVEGTTRKNIIEDLKALLMRNDYKLSTGFIGTSTLLQTLSKNDMNEIAYKLLLQEKNLSWLYSINQGATTIWERWDSYTKEKGFNENGMNSFNHFSYGSVGEWFYEYMLGIRYNLLNEYPVLLEPGIVIGNKENPISKCKGCCDSDFGKIEIMWELKDGRFQYSVDLPVNARAQLLLPVLKDDNEQLVMNGKTIQKGQLETQPGIDRVNIDGGRMILWLDSGKYDFEFTCQ